MQAPNTQGTHRDSAQAQGAKQAEVRREGAHCDSTRAAVGDASGVALSGKAFAEKNWGEQCGGLAYGRCR